MDCRGAPARIPSSARRRNHGTTLENAADATTSTVPMQHPRGTGGSKVEVVEGSSCVGICFATAQLTPGGIPMSEIYPPPWSVDRARRGHALRGVQLRCEERPRQRRARRGQHVEPRSRAGESRHARRSRSSRTFPRPRRPATRKASAPERTRRATPTRPAHAEADPQAPRPTTTPSGNTVTTNPGGRAKPRTAAVQSARSPPARRSTARDVEDLHEHERGRRSRDRDARRTRCPARTARRFPRARRST